MSSMSGSVPEATAAKAALGSTEIRRFLEEFVRRRVPVADVEDVVQTVLVDALAAERIPESREELRKWLVGIARHKVADHHRRTMRERTTDPPEPEASPAPLEAREMVRWAEKQAAGKDAQKTLSWMAREGEGEKLESIAAEERIPAARVRQRVSRMRRWMKERWLAELAAVAVIGLIVLLLLRFWRVPDELPQAVPETPKPVQPELERARQLRAESLEKCRRGEHRACLDGLDEAKRLDPAGDTAPEVQDARKKAEEALTPPPPTSVEAPLPEPKESKVEPRRDEKPIAPPAPKPRPKLDKKLEMEGELQMQAEIPTQKNADTGFVPKAPPKNGPSKKAPIFEK